MFSQVHTKCFRAGMWHGTLSRNSRGKHPLSGFQFKFQRWFLLPLPAKAPGKVTGAGPGAWALPSKWEAQVELLVPGFHPAQPKLLRPFGK